LTVVVHQHLLTKKFDMRDRLVLRKAGSHSATFGYRS
jgi:hypothetical protein